MRDQDQYEDCDMCGERYSGAEIRSWLVEVEEPEGTGFDASTVTGIYCKTCLPKRPQERTPQEVKP